MPTSTVISQPAELGGCASLDDLADLDLERMRNTKTHSMDSAQACHSLAFRHCSSVFHGAAEPCVLLWFPCLVDPPTLHAEMLKSCIYAKCIPPPLPIRPVWAHLVLSLHPLPQNTVLNWEDVTCRLSRESTVRGLALQHPYAQGFGVRCFRARLLPEF